MVLTLIRINPIIIQLLAARTESIKNILLFLVVVIGGG